jgi:SAM-dependent methyltransferase
MDSKSWDERYATKEYVWKVTVNQFVEKHLSDLEPGTAIDLAAGEGRNSVWLASRGWKVTAVDFSPVGLEKARRLADDNSVEITTLCADALTWEPAEPVDLVVLSYLQLPTDQRNAVLSRVRGWLAPGATLFIIAHDRSNIAGGHGGPQDPDVCYEPAETAAALEGLAIDVAEVAERHVETPEGERTALDTLVVARRPT